MISEVDSLELKILSRGSFFLARVYFTQRPQGSRGSRRKEFHAKSLPAAAKQRGKERKGLIH